MMLTHPYKAGYKPFISCEWGGYSGHKGRDYGWLLAHPVVSKEVYPAAPGKIVAITDGGGYNQGWGNQITIQHTDQSWTTYSHLKTGSMLVKVGQIVGIGTRLATMGQTGDARGVHLHLEVRIGKNDRDHRVDPRTYFTKELPGVSVLPAPATAGSSVVHVQVTTTALHLRQSASENSKSLGVMPKNTVVTTSRYKGDWDKVTWGSKHGYAHIDFMVWRDRSTTAALNLRSGPSTKNKILTVLPKGTKVQIISVVGTTDTARWAKVKAAGKTGYVDRGFLK